MEEQRDVLYSPYEDGEGDSEHQGEVTLKE